MLVLIGDPDSLVVARKVTWRDRAAARCRAAALDRELARGVPPEDGVALALRARNLVRPRTRRRLAQTLERLLVEAVRSSPRMPPAVPILQCARIRRSAGRLQTLIDHLVQPAPVSARGVALVGMLLSDGASPLYVGRGDGDLDDRIDQALQALEPLSDWYW